MERESMTAGEFRNELLQALERPEEWEDCIGNLYRRVLHSKSGIFFQPYDVESEPPMDMIPIFFSDHNQLSVELLRLPRIALVEAMRRLEDHANECREKFLEQKLGKFLQEFRGFR